MNISNHGLAEGAGEQLPVPSTEPAGRADRIVVVCPGCQATLSVRRAYIGNQVRCKQCEHVFPVTAAAAAQPKPAEGAPAGMSAPPAPQDRIEGDSRRLENEHKLLLDEHARIMAAHGQLQEAHRRLEVEDDKLKTVRDELREQLDRVTNELNEVRGYLGPIAPAEVRSLAEECESLRAEVSRVRDENRDLRADQSARADLAAELEQSDASLAAARDDLGRLTAQLKQRDSDLDAARGELSRVSREYQNATEEIAGLRSTLAERDQAMRTQGDQLGAQVESHKSALVDAKQVHREAIDRLNAELAALQKSDIDLDAARADLGRLTEQLKERDSDFDGARAELGRLSREYQNATEEITGLQSTLAERDLAMRTQGDQLGAQVESHKGALDHAEQVHREAIDRLNAELAALQESNIDLDAARDDLGRLTEQIKQRDSDLNAARAELSRVSREYQNATEEIEGLRSTLAERDQAMVDAERTKQQELAEQVLELRARLEEGAQVAEQVSSTHSSLSEAGVASDAELETARAQVEDLKARLMEAERLNSEMAAVLDGIGIRYRLPNLEAWLKT